MKLKKIMCVALSAVVLSGSVYGLLPCDVVNVAEAATGTNLKNAKTIGTGVSVTGKVSGTTSSQVYKFTAISSGYVSFDITRKKMEKAVEPSWKITVMDGSGTAVSEEHGATFSTRPVMMKKDDIYYAVVENYSHSDGEEFLLSAVFTDYANVIAEPCDKVEEAVVIDSDSTFLGAIDMSRDKDYIKITAPEKGYVRLDFKKYNSTSTLSPSWKLNFFDSDLNALFTVRSEYVMDTLSTEGLYFALPEGKSIYLEVENAHNSAGVMYSLRARFTESSLVEKEPNNSFSHANNIKLKKTYKGSLAEGKTGDYFKFKAASDGKYVAELKLSNELSKGYKITLYDQSKKEISVKRDITEAGKLSFKAKKGKTYYVVLEHVSLYKSGYNALYKLKITKR